MKTRREFISKTSMAALGAVTTTHSSQILAPGKELVHHVFFWLKNSGADADRNKLIEGLKTLKAIKTVKSLHIGTPAATEKRDVIDDSYDVSELIFFNSIENQNAYQTDPIHVKFVNDYGHLWERVVVYDSMGI
ncbi:MAG TPA: Dabb family protein [Cyclobacteriaceae bacterium]|nr:Dabb family protein [Cyclobacteriaceae bacterium]